MAKAEKKKVPSKWANRRKSHAEINAESKLTRNVKNREDNKLKDEKDAKSNEAKNKKGAKLKVVKGNGKK